MNIETPNIFHKVVLSGGITMKSARLIMALIAASILIMPAFSMQDHGKDCCCDQNACIACHKLMAIEKAGCCGPEMGPATDNAREQFCKLCMKSMMGCGCQDPLMGCQGPLMGCQGPLMGCQGPLMGCQGPLMGCQGNAEQGTSCQGPLMGCQGKDKQDCGCVPKIYFEGQDNQMPMVG
jgi:hypothetical protein